MHNGGIADFDTVVSKIPRLLTYAVGSNDNFLTQAQRHVE